MISGLEATCRLPHHDPCSFDLGKNNLVRTYEGPRQLLFAYHSCHLSFISTLPPETSLSSKTYSEQKVQALNGLQISAHNTIQMSRIAVKMESDTVPVTGVDELDQHLDELVTDPNLPLKEKLFDDVELQLSGLFPLHPTTYPVLI